MTASAIGPAAAILRERWDLILFLRLGREFFDDLFLINDLRQIRNNWFRTCLKWYNCCINLKDMSELDCWKLLRADVVNIGQMWLRAAWTAILKFQILFKVRNIPSPTSRTYKRRSCLKTVLELSGARLQQYKPGFQHILLDVWVR